MKSKLLSLLALIAGIQFASAQPTLGILRTNKLLLLHWSTNAPGYSLQAATSLAAPNWQSPADAAPAVYGSENAMTVSNSPQARFFRLYHQQMVSTPDGMALIPAGTFIMGDAVDNGVAAINVNVSAFYIGTNLVRYDEWTSNYSYAVGHGYSFDHSGYGKANNHPVCQINWYDAVKWCNARSQHAGLTPVYYTDAAMTTLYTNGDIDGIYPNWTNKGYRLPTEAEWEKAARGGLDQQRFPWGNTISESQADYIGSSLSYDMGPVGYNATYNTGGPPFTSPVGSFAPNGYGVFDMAGNLYQWCWDWGGSPYAGGTDPHGPASGGSRSLRGGDWGDTANDAITGARNVQGPSSALLYWGMRCVRNY
jgi:formylglycine-generating enzyme required for sulfatase activity